MEVSEEQLKDFSPRVVHSIVRKFMTPRMGVYWADFLLTLCVGFLAFAAVPWFGYLSLGGAIAFVVSVLALYRAAVFIHEIVHFRSRRQFDRFRVAWNVLCGIPLFIPLFMYECHAEHHSRKWYGTANDAEYLPLARMAPREIVGILAAVPLLPLFGPLRFGVLTPCPGSSRLFAVTSTRTCQRSNWTSSTADGRLPVLPNGVRGCCRKPAAS